MISQEEKLLKSEWMDEHEGRPKVLEIGKSKFKRTSTEAATTEGERIAQLRKDAEEAKEKKKRDGSRSNYTKELAEAAFKGKKILTRTTFGLTAHTAHTLAHV